MSTLDKLCLGWLIVWFVIGIALFLRLRNRSQPTTSGPSPWFMWSSGLIMPVMHLAAHHAHDHPWLMWVVGGLPLIWIVTFVGYSWHESNKAHDKAVREGRMRAVYNDWAKPDPE